MKQPLISDLVEKTNSKYALVVITAKRARQITEAGSSLIEDKATKPVTISLYEIMDDKIKWRQKDTS